MADFSNYPLNASDLVTFLDVSDSLSAFTRRDRDNESAAGLAWIDYDNDGDLDLFLTNDTGESNGLFENIGENQFVNVSASAGVESFEGHSAIVVGDLNNDGYPELLLSGIGGVFGSQHSQLVLYLNNQDGTFTNITPYSGLTGPKTASAATFGDINRDGFLDIYITASGHMGTASSSAAQYRDRLYLNNGDMTFTDITEESGIIGDQGSCSASFTDFNLDGWQDVLIGICQNIFSSPTPFHVFRNNKNNTFTDVAQEAGLDTLGYWMGMAIGDVNNDGFMDLFATNFGPLSPTGDLANHALFINNGDGTYSEQTPEEIGNNQLALGATFADWNNDGWLDLLFTGSLPKVGAIGPNDGNPGRLFFNLNGQAWEENNHSHQLNLENVFTSGLARADYNNDGFVDFAILSSSYDNEYSQSDSNLSNMGAPILMQNQGNQNHWLSFRLIGVESNKMGIGARLDVYSKLGRQVREVQAGSSFRSSESPWPVFGIGTETSAILKVTWPLGRQEWFHVKINQRIDIIEGSGWETTNEKSFINRIKLLMPGIKIFLQRLDRFDV